MILMNINQGGGKEEKSHPKTQNGLYLSLGKWYVKCWLMFSNGAFHLCETSEFWAKEEQDGRDRAGGHHPTRASSQELSLFPAHIFLTFVWMNVTSWSFVPLWLKTYRITAWF